MADISKIKLPDNSVVNIKDYRIPGVDSTPTSGSDNVVTSGGVYSAIEASPDTKNTAGATNTTDKIYVVGAKTQGDNPQTYTNINVYEQNGELTASKFNGPLETSYSDTTNNLSMYKSVGLNKKVYTGVLGVANGSSPNNNTYANQSVYFLTIHPTSWDAEWGIKYRLNIHLDNETQLYKSSSTESTVSAGVYTRGIYDCNLNGTAGTYSTFHMFQSQKNTSYRPIYYHMFHSTTSAGYTAGNGHKIGVCFYSSYLPTPVTDYSSGSAVANTKYTRTIEVIVEEAINCTFELAETLEVEGDAYRTDYTKLNTTYYTTNTSSSNSAGRWINLSATTQGLYESGDDNTYTYTQQSSNYMKNTTKSGDTGVKLWSYPLVGFDKDGNAMGISVYSGSQSSSTTSVSAKGTRLYCTEGFDYTKGIRYVSTSSSFAYNTDMNISTQINYSGVDFRYTDNCVASATANNLGMVNRKPVYLRGTIGSDGLFYLAPIDVTYNNGTYQRAWVQDVPSIENENGEYVYWFIGYPYYNSSYTASLYQLNLITQGELVWYKDGNLKPYATGNYNDLINKPTILNNVFVAESGITTYNEVMQACLAKRIVFAWDNAAELMEFYPLVKYNDDNNTFYFLKIRDRDCYYYLTLNNNDEWYSDYEPLSIKTINNISLIGSGNLTVVTDVSGKEDKSNKVTYISNASTDTNYPSAKAVNTALSTKANLNGDISEDFSVEKLNLASEGTGGNDTTEGVWDNGELSLNSSKKLEVKYKVSVIEEGASEPTASVVTKTVAYTTDLPDLSGKQDVLISGTNIKTVNNESLLGSGNVTVADGKSAYQLWLEAGNSGTLQQFLASLQGNSGYTGNLNELEIVNDLTTGGTTKALSAQMGVQLKADLDGKFIFLSESEFEALTVLDQNKIYCTYEDDI